MVQSLFSIINFILPSQIPYYFNLFFSYAQMGNGIFPMSDILLALFSVISVWVLLYIIKIILWGIQVIPFIGRLGGILPQHTMTNSAYTTTTTDKNGNIKIKRTSVEASRIQKKRWM